MIPRSCGAFVRADVQRLIGAQCKSSSSLDIKVLGSKGLIGAHCGPKGLTGAQKGLLKIMRLKFVPTKNEPIKNIGIKKGSGRNFPKNLLFRTFYTSCAFFNT